MKAARSSAFDAGLLMAGAGARIAVALVVIVLLWLAVAWASFASSAP
jgi:hypothetical protein